MSFPPRISVIMPVFNEAEFVHDAIQSILDQTFADFEFIIIDDGSTDATLPIIQSFQDPRIRCIIQENKGLTRSLNNGLSLATGQYIARMDGNDISLTNRFKMQVDFLDTHCETGLVGAFYFNIDQNGKLVKKYTYQTEDQVIRKILLTDCPFCHSLVMFRKLCVDAVGGYRDKIGPAEDYDLWFRISEKYLVANIPVPLHKVRIMASGITLGRRIDQIRAIELVRHLAEERKRVGSDSLEAMPDEAITGLLDRLHPKTAKNIRSADYSTAIYLAAVFYSVENFGDSLKQLRSALMLNIFAMRNYILLFKLMLCYLLPAPVRRFINKKDR